MQPPFMTDGDIDSRFRQEKHQTQSDPRKCLPLALAKRHKIEASQYALAYRFSLPKTHLRMDAEFASSFDLNKENYNQTYKICFDKGKETGTRKLRLVYCKTPERCFISQSARHHIMFSSRIAKDADGHRLLLVSRFLESLLG